MKTCKLGHDYVPKDSKNKRGCPICHKNYGKEYALKYPEKMVINAIKWRDENRRTAKNATLKYKYGITINDYDALLIKQNNVCAICNKSETRIINGKAQSLAVDHCHSTGKVRGLLCYKCNTAIGKFSDSPEIILKAASYVALKGII